MKKKEYKYLFIIISMFFEYIQLSDKYKNIQPLEKCNIIYILLLLFSTYLLQIVTYKFELLYYLLAYCIFTYLVSFSYLYILYIHDSEDKKENEYWFSNFIFSCIMYNILMGIGLKYYDNIYLTYLVNILVFNIFFLFYLDCKYEDTCYAIDYIYNCLIVLILSYIVLLLNINYFLPFYLIIQSIGLYYYYYKNIKDNVYSISIVVVV